MYWCFQAGGLLAVHSICEQHVLDLCVMSCFFICDPAFSACTATRLSASRGFTGYCSYCESIFSSFQTCWFPLPVIHIWPASVSCLPLPNFLHYHLLSVEHQSPVLLVQPVISAWLGKGMWEETLECYLGSMEVFDIHICSPDTSTSLGGTLNSIGHPVMMA